MFFCARSAHDSTTARSDEPARSALQGERPAFLGPYGVFKFAASLPHDLVKPAIVIRGEMVKESELFDLGVTSSAAGF